MLHKANFWDPFGDDRLANQAAQDALQPAAELAAARLVYDRIPAGRPDARFRQNEHVERLSGDFDAFADRAGVDRALFRETLERKLRRDHGGSPNLSPLPPREVKADDARHALEMADFAAMQAEAAAATRLASAKRIHGERQQERLRTERALREYDQARSAAA